MCRLQHTAYEETFGGWAALATGTELVVGKYGGRSTVCSL